MRWSAIPPAPSAATRPGRGPGRCAWSSRRAVPSEGSGHRATPPEATLEKYGHLVSPIVGIVSMVEPPPGTGGVFQVCVGGANGAIPVDSLEGFKTSLRHRSAGKGPTLVQARASALAESLERYSTEFTGSEFRILGSCRELAGQRHPPQRGDGIQRTAVPGAGRLERARARGSIPCPSPWIRTCRSRGPRCGPSPRSGRGCCPPSCSTSPAPPPPRTPPRCCRACSNGNAAGNNLEEAVLQGFLELVERDATAIWWYNRLRRPGVDLDSFGLPYLADLAAHYAPWTGTCGRWISPTTWASPPSPPCPAARQTRGQVLFGLGCSLDPVRRPGAGLRGAEPVHLGHRPQEPVAPGRRGDPALAAHGDPGQPALPGPGPRGPGPAAGGFHQRRQRRPPGRTSGSARALVEAKGMEMLVLDLTRADAGMPVAKVIVPGLRHFWARFAPGRLYDVPVAMGWLERPLAEEELNPPRSSSDGRP